MMNNKLFRVQFPDGVYKVPEQDLDEATQEGGVVLDNDLIINPSNSQNNNSPTSQANNTPTPKMYRVQFPDGIYKVPEHDLKEATREGGSVIDDYNSAGKFAARSAKTAGSVAAGGVIDTVANAIYNIPAAIQNAKPQVLRSLPIGMPDDPGDFFIPNPLKQKTHIPDLPLIPSVTEAVDKSIDSATGDYTHTKEGDSVQSAIRLVADVATPGGFAKISEKYGAEFATKLFNLIGTTKVPGLAAAGTAGYVGQELSNSGAGALESFGGGVGAGIAADVAANVLNPKTLPKNIARTATKMAGFGKNNLDMKGIESAKALGMELPNIAATKGTLPAFAHTAISKAPYFGDKLRSEIESGSKQFQNAWHKMMETVGPIKTEEVARKNKTLYEFVENSIPEKDEIFPKSILEDVLELEKGMKSPIHSDSAEKLKKVIGKLKSSMLVKDPIPPKFSELSPTIQKEILHDLIPNFNQFPPNVQQQILEHLPPESLPTFDKYPKHIKENILKSMPDQVTSMPARELWEAKMQINELMKEQNIFNSMDTRTFNRIEKLRQSINESLDNYGKKQNPKFSEALGDADMAHAKTAKREELENLFSSKIVDPKTGDVSYNSLLVALGDRKKQKFLENNLGKQNYQKLEHFINVAKSMEGAKRRNPNPSGSAAVGMIAYLLGQIHTGIPIAAAGVAYVGTELLTNKRFLNAVTRYAKEPTESLAKQIEGIVKESTGMTIQELQKSIVDNQPEDEREED